MSVTNTSPAEAEAGAEAARAELAGTLSQLRDNLRPANMVNEVMTNAKISASAITDQIWETARKNPLPALMIGAGLAMILGVGQRVVSSSRQSGGSSYPPASGSVQRAVGDVLSTTNDRIVAATSRGASAIGDAFHDTDPREGSTMRSDDRTRDRLSHALTRVIEEQPLVLAALGLAVGAAIGSAIPQTATENDLMGSASGSMRDAAKSMVQDEYSQLKSAATHAIDEMKQTVADHGVTTENLSGLVQDLGDKAKTATYDAGKTLDPTT